MGEIDPESAVSRPTITRERIGRHHGSWRDVTLVERRSPSVG
jgi:phosphinothricin acetyltransferase